MLRNFVLYSLLLLGTAFSVQASENTHQKVVLQLKWLHQFQFAGYYAAQKQGYFADEGLDVEIRERDLRQNNIDQVLDGDAQYGIADSVLLLYQAKQKPIVIIAPIFQHSPQALITLKSSGLDSPYKLNNKRIAFYPKDTDGFSILAMSHQIGLSTMLDRVFMKTDPSMLIRGEADAYAGYLTNEPYYFLKQGIEINVIKPMNYGIDLYGDMLFTTKEEVQNHPERVAAFRKATIKGWRYALAHKREMAQYILDTYHPANKTLDHLLFEAHAIEDMMDINSTPIGTLDAGRLQFIRQLFTQHGLINNRWDISEGIYRPTPTLLQFSNQELEWMKNNPIIRLGIDPQWYPIDFVDNQGHFSGISAGVFDFIARKTGLKFETDPSLNWSETVKQAKQKQIDMFSAVISTEQRRAYMNFTQPYLKFPMVIATQSGTPYLSDLKFLSQKKLAVVRDYAAHDFLKSNFPQTKLIFVKSPQQGLEAVAQGIAFGYIDNVAVIGGHIRRSGLTNLQIGGELPFRADVAIGIRDDWPELTGIIKKVLTHLPAEDLEKMQSQYLKVNYQESFDWFSVLMIALPLTVIITIILLLNRQLLSAQKALKEKNAILERISTTDHLTQIYNRSFVDKTLSAEMARSRRYRTPLSVLLFDLDKFKLINDQYGHDIGDKVLIQFAKLVETITRETDVFGRWGGEEFILLCPNTDMQQAYQLAEKIRLCIAETPTTEDIAITTSIGVSEFDFRESSNQLLKRCDQALYKAKDSGRNKSILSTP